MATIFASRLSINELKGALISLDVHVAFQKQTHGQWTDPYAQHIEYQM